MAKAVRLIPAARRARPRAGRRVTAAGCAVLVGLLAACGSSSEAADPPPAAAAEDVDPQLAKLVPADIAERGTLRVVLDPSNPPMESLAEDQKTVVGIDPDLMNEIARRLGLTVEWESSNLGTIIASLQAHRHDLSIAAMSDTPERRAVVDFVHYFQSPGGVIVRQDDELAGADDLLDLCGVKTAVVAGSAQVPVAQTASEDCVDNGLPPLELSEFPNVSAQNIALESDRVRAALMDKIAAGEMVKETAGGLAVTPIFYEVGGPAGIVFPKDTPEVRDAVQASLQSMMDDGSYQEILDSWGPAVGEAGLPEATIGTSG